LGPQQRNLPAGTEFAYLNPDKLTFTPTGVFEDGSTKPDGD
jgi:hypothetical protein